MVKGFRWIQTYLPDILLPGCNYEHNIVFAHDASKYEPEEYDAYDVYFYGHNRSYKVVQNFNYAWLHHIHENPHHWQHWVLINDDPEEGDVALDIPYEYIIEMICDWWSFSWSKGDLTEVFSWYRTHRERIEFSRATRKTVEDILVKMGDKLAELSGWETSPVNYILLWRNGKPNGILDEAELSHHGVKGQKWGVRNGPPYPLDKSQKSDTIVSEAIVSGEVSTTINPDKQRRHTLEDHTPGRSYLNGDVDYAQKLVDKLSGTGEPLVSNDVWLHKERVVNNEDIGFYANADGEEVPSDTAMIIYSKTGTHIYPIQRKEEKVDET